MGTTEWAFGLRDGASHGLFHLSNGTGPVPIKQICTKLMGGISLTPSWDPRRRPTRSVSYSSSQNLSPRSQLRSSPGGSNRTSRTVYLSSRNRPRTLTLNGLSIEDHLPNSDSRRGVSRFHGELTPSSPAPNDSPVMSTNDPSTAGSRPTQQPSPDTDLLGAGFSPQPGIEAGATSTKNLRQTDPDTAACASCSATRIFRTAGLSQAHDILRDGVPHLICLSTDHLWESYSLDYCLLAKVKSHLVETGLLSIKGEWGDVDGEKLNRNHFAAWSESADEAFVFFSHLFNTVLGYLRHGGHGVFAQEMVHAASKSAGYRPDAFLHTAIGTPPAPGKFRWRDLICPFEYKFGDGDTVDASRRSHHLRYGKTALWYLQHIMRTDPRRMFSFGSTVRGTKFRIWLLCRTAPFTFTPFDWFDVGSASTPPLLAYLTLLRTLIHSSSSSSLLPPPPR